MAANGSANWQAATAGTYGDRRVPRPVAAAFLAIALAVVLLPFIAMAWAPADEATANQKLAPLPSLAAQDGGPNLDYLSELGEYFSDRFGYRDGFITANARLRALLGTSATDQVVVGADGWLYYGGTLPDYLGQSLLPEESLAAIAHNLALAQQYAEGLGASFAFAIAPDKNSLWPDAMPYYYLRSTQPGNAERLKPYLEEAGVSYADLFAVFRDAMAAGEPVHYLKTDSHWDNYGAAGAFDALAESLGRQPLAAAEADGFWGPGTVGDLQAMLYPDDDTREDNWFLPGYNDGEGFAGSRWSYEEGSAVTDSRVATVAAGDAEGRLLMFRDSFGSALLPYGAATFEEALFSKMIPYDMGQAASMEATAVVIERAERHLGYLASNPPVFPSPRLAAEEAIAGKHEVASSAAVEQDGSYQVVRGTMDLRPGSAEEGVVAVAYLADGGTIALDPFWTGPESEDDEGSMGFMLYVPESDLDLDGAEFRVFAD